MEFYVLHTLPRYRAYPHIKGYLASIQLEPITKKEQKAKIDPCSFVWKDPKNPLAQAVAYSANDKLHAVDLAKGKKATFVEEQFEDGRLIIYRSRFLFSVRGGHHHSCKH